jgi:hypothetical protein
MSVLFFQNFPMWPLSKPTIALGYIIPESANFHEIDGSYRCREHDIGIDIVDNCVLMQETINIMI